MEPVHLLFIDDETVLQNALIERLRKWETEISPSFGLECRVRTGLGDVSKKDLEWSDVLVVDYYLSETKSGLEYVEQVDFSRQLCLLVSAKSDAVYAFYAHPLAFRHPGRLMMVPKTDLESSALTTRQREEAETVPWWGSVLKPCLKSFCRVVASERLARENLEEKRYLEKQFDGISQIRTTTGPRSLGPMIGQSPAMRRLFALAARVAELPSPVLVTGETGSGKDLLVGCIHENSSRRGKPLQIVACSNLQETLLDSELFGVIANYPGFHHKEGLTGKIASADGGSVFLNEIGDMPLASQAKLLGVFDSYEPASGYEVTRIGERKAHRFDVRFLAATNVNIEDAVEKGTFRRDLFRRINVIRIHIPPLRDRREDIPLLVVRFVEAKSKQMNLDAPVIAGAALRRLVEYDWPGNVGELASFVEKVVGLFSGETIDASHEVIQDLGKKPQTVIPPHDPDSIWNSISAGTTSKRLAVLARDHGVPTTIEIVRRAVQQMGGRFPTDAQCSKMFGGMNNNSFRVWLKQNGHTLNDLK